MRKIPLLTMVLACCLLFATVGQAEAAKAWRLSHYRPVGSTMDDFAKKFVAEVATATEGRIKIDVYPAAQLGGSEVVMERVGMGAIEMFVGFPSATLTPKLDIITAPTLISSFEQIDKLVSPGSPFMDILQECFAEVDIHALTAYSGDFAGLSFKTAVPGMLDPNAKHTEKIRSSTQNSFRYTAEALGYLATPIPVSELFTALQAGLVEGTFGNGVEIVYLQFREMIKHFVHIRAQADVFFLAMNKDLFDGLDKKDQEILTKIAQRLGKEQTAAAKQAEQMWEKRLIDSGTKVYHLTDEQQAAFHKIIRESAWPKLRKDLGEDFFDNAVKVRNEVLQ